MKNMLIPTILITLSIGGMLPQAKAENSLILSYPEKSREYLESEAKFIPDFGGKKKAAQRAQLELGIKRDVDRESVIQVTLTVKGISYYDKQNDRYLHYKCCQYTTLVQANFIIRKMGQRTPIKRAYSLSDKKLFDGESHEIDIGSDPDTRVVSLEDIRIEGMRWGKVGDKENKNNIYPPNHTFPNIVI